MDIIAAGPYNFIDNRISGKLVNYGLVVQEMMNENIETTNIRMLPEFKQQ